MRPTVPAACQFTKPFTSIAAFFLRDLWTSARNPRPTLFYTTDHRPSSCSVVKPGVGLSGVASRLWGDRGPRARGRLPPSRGVPGWIPAFSWLLAITRATAKNGPTATSPPSRSPSHLESHLSFQSPSPPAGSSACPPRLAFQQQHGHGALSGMSAGNRQNRQEHSAYCPSPSDATAPCGWDPIWHHG